MEPTPPKAEHERQDDLSAVLAATKVKEMRQKIRLGKDPIITAAVEKLYIGKLCLICLQTKAQPNRSNPQHFAFLALSYTNTFVWGLQG